jgi:hypothetical protein
VTLRDHRDGLLAFDDDGVFDFSDDDGLPGPAARERRLATGTMPRLEAPEPPLVEPSDSRRATTRMSLEDVLELRAHSLEAPPERAAEIAPAEEPAPPIPRDAVPFLLPVVQPGWRRVANGARATWARLLVRRWELREVAVAFAAGFLAGLLATC